MITKTQENVIKGPWQPRPQAHSVRKSDACHLCGRSEGRAVMHESGLVACYDCVTELYFTAVRHEQELRRAAEEKRA